jgi:hypothetical protein
MIRMLVSLGHWLEARFPEKLEVVASDYLTLKAQVDVLISLSKQYEVSIQRISALEKAAVHKGAVQDLVSVVAGLKQELASFKTSLGFSVGPEVAKIEAYLSGEPVSKE